MCGRVSAGHRLCHYEHASCFCQCHLVVWPDISDPDDKEHIIRNIIIISQ